MTKIGLLIPSTSKNRNWSTYEDTYLFKYTLKTFLNTRDVEHEYVFYIGIDDDDPIYGNQSIQESFHTFSENKFVIRFIKMGNISKGHLTVMWNKLFDVSFKDGCDYFYQCGDDIVFHTKGWINESIKTLQQHDHIGVTGPRVLTQCYELLTQSFVSRKHMEIFGYYFPPEIINWFCDDWINLVYKRLSRFFPLEKYHCENKGGPERYIYDKNKDKLRSHCNSIVERDLKRICNHEYIATLKKGE